MNLRVISSVYLAVAGIFVVPILGQSEDKSGVRPQVISLPSGPGSIEGLGGAFEPQLNTGTAVYSVKITVPPGINGHQPELALVYNSGNGNGPFGIGWSVDLPYVQRQTDKGVPKYDSTDTFVFSNGEELVPLANGTWREENEGSFRRYQRLGSGWEVTDKDGTKHYFGESAGSRIERAPGEAFKWCITRSVDTNGNVIEYNYIQFPSESKYIYPREIKYSIFGGAFQSVVFDYQSRPDRFGDFSSGIDIRCTRRCAAIRVLSIGSLVRRYQLQYNVDPQFDPPAQDEVDLQFSLLRSVFQYGADNLTFLPPQRFAYYRFCNQGQVTQTVSPHPLRSIRHADTELLDVDGDALPDVLWTTTPKHRYYRNLGNNQFDADGEDFTTSPAGVSLNSANVQLADVNGDGLADLLHRRGNGPFDLDFYLNPGTYGWDAVQAFQFAAQPFLLDVSTRLLDLNYDKRIDAMRTSTAGYTYYLGNENGTWSTVGPLPTVNFQVMFDNPYTRLADMNGDRMQDLVFISRSGSFSSFTYWPAIGAFTWGAAVVMPTQLLVGLDPGERLMLSDVNGDGLADTLLVNNGSVSYWLNSGNNDWLSPIDVSAPSYTVGAVTLRMADMNGNGSADLVYEEEGGAVPLQYLDFTPGTKPNLLRLVDNGLGQRTTIEYRTSTDYFVEAQNAASIPDWTTKVAFPVHLVSKATTSDGRGGEYITEYRYWDGYYDGAEKEFRGFGYVEVRELGDATAPTKLTRHWFDVGMTEESLKGKPLAQELAETDGTLINRTDNSWSTTQLLLGLNGESVTFAFNNEARTTVVEGSSTPVSLRTDFAYDAYGNVTEELNYGIVDPIAPPGDLVGLSLGNDEVLTRRQFLYDPITWIVDRKKSERIENLAGALQAETRSYYDDLPLGQLTIGNLTRQEDWLNTEQRYIATLSNSYDGFGNVCELTDANGHSRTIDYGDVLHTYPTAETIHLESYDLGMAATYDLGLGTVLSSTDFAGATTNYIYDTFGRLTAINRPGGAEELYEYYLSSPISHLVKRVRESVGGGTYDSYTYFDGLGRKLGSKIEGENVDGTQQWRFLEAVTFNARRLALRQWLPYFTDSSNYEDPDPAEPFNAMEYDVQDRVVKATNPDSTYTLTSYETQGPDRLLRHEWDENDTAGANSPHTYQTDGLDRLVQVEERNGTKCLLGIATCACLPEDDNCFATQYDWSTLGDLVRITDAQSNVKLLKYDSLRRMTFMNDPDRGHMRYAYDDVGNLIQTIDAKQQVIRYSYDFANRLLAENYLDKGGPPCLIPNDSPGCDPIDVAYVYDVPSINVDFGDTTSGSAEFTAGRLAAVLDLSGEEHNSYDVRGNITWTTKVIRDPQLNVLVSFTTRFLYDAMDRITDLYYPDNDHMRYLFNDASFVERIDGGPNGQVIISNVDYEPMAQAALQVFGNGADTVRTYDNRDRLSTLLTTSPAEGELIHYLYQYDPVANITQISDHRPFANVPSDSPRRNTQVFQYDDLYRLTQVRYARNNDPASNDGQIDYSYDKIGNMLGKASVNINDHLHVNVGALEYGGSVDGATSRIGRAPGDAPGPHALTRTSNGVVADETYIYDANGNVLVLDGAALTWDFKNRLICYEKDDVRAIYTYDHINRRISKRITKGVHTDQTLYPTRVFEIRPHHSPVKFVFDGDARVAKANRMLAPSRTTLQRLWLMEGWNLINVSAMTTQTLGEMLGHDVLVFVVTGNSYELVSTDTPTPVRQPLWVNVPTSRVAVAVGSYLPTAFEFLVPEEGAHVAWPGFGPLIMESHVLGNAELQVYDALASRWRLVVTGQAEFLSDTAAQVSLGSSFWALGHGETYISVPATQPDGVLFYHLDHLGSSSQISDLDGALTLEFAFYPFGHPRIEYSQNNNPAPGIDHQFTGKERDRESGLSYFEDRYLHTAVGRFLSPDRIATLEDVDDIEALLHDPQLLNPYAYALNNPLAYNDPTGKLPNFLIGAVGGAIAGAILEATSQTINAMATGKQIDLDWSKIGTEALIGAAEGFATGGLAAGAKVAKAAKVVGKAVELSKAVKSPLKEIGKHILKKAAQTADTPGSVKGLIRGLDAVQKHASKAGLKLNAKLGSRIKNDTARKIVKTATIKTTQGAPGEVVPGGPSAGEIGKSAKEGVLNALDAKPINKD